MTDVTFTYPGAGTPVLEDVSLTVSPGESVAVSAPSGAGKSTLLHLAGLLLQPQSGSILLGGRHVTPRDASSLLGRQIVWILQTVSLLPRRTVIDNVMLPALIQGSTRAAAYSRAEEMLHAMSIDVDRLMHARHLSGGQAQRVGIARALMCDPGLLIADEPTANLDLSTARQVARTILTATEGRTAVLIATHDPVVADMAHRQVRLDELRSSLGHVVPG